MGNEAGDFFLMALRTPPPPDPDADRRRGGRHGAAAAQKNAAALGFSWDVLARKRVIGGGPAAQRNSGSSTTATTTNSNTAASISGSSPARPAGSSFGDGGASNVPVAANATVGSGGGGGDGFDPVDRRKPGFGAGRRGRRSKNSRVRKSGAAAPVAGDTGYGGGGGGEISFLSPPRPSKGSKDGFPSPHYAASPPRVSPAAKAMIAVSVLRFSPHGGVLAAACGISIHLYCEAAGAGTAATAAPGTTESSGRGAYRRYAACKGHATKVRSFDFSRDGSVLQSNDASGELLFWEVSTGKQVHMYIYRTTGSPVIA